MVKTIKVIRLAPGESILIVAAPGPDSPCDAVAACPCPCREQCNACDLHDQQAEDKVIALFHVA